VCGSYAAASQKSNAARIKWLRWSVIQTAEWGRGEGARERWLKRTDCLQRKGFYCQATDSEGTRKRFFYRCRPWEGFVTTITIDLTIDHRVERHRAGRERLQVRDRGHFTAKILDQRQSFR
jgi:hypothetical protein